jgi:hypothetical protein
MLKLEISYRVILRSILEDDSISSTSEAHIHSCLNKGVGLWLVVRPSIVRFASHTLLSS